VVGGREPLAVGVGHPPRLAQLSKAPPRDLRRLPWRGAACCHRRLGDTGVLTALKLAKRFEVTGNLGETGSLSGQELGVRWPGPTTGRVTIDRVRPVPRAGPGAAPYTNTERAGPAGPHGRSARGRRTTQVPFDILVISTGVTNGFWRRPHWQTADRSMRTCARCTSASRVWARSR
jgi:hypothetical protein